MTPGTGPVHGASRNLVRSRPASAQPHHTRGDIAAVLAAKVSARRAPHLGARGLSRAIIWPRPTSPVDRVYVADPGAVGRNFTGFQALPVGQAHPLDGSTVALPNGSQPDNVLFNSIRNTLVGHDHWQRMSPLSLTPIAKGAPSKLSAKEFAVLEAWMAASPAGASLANLRLSRRPSGRATASGDRGAEYPLRSRHF